MTVRIVHARRARVELRPSGARVLHERAPRDPRRADRRHRAGGDRPPRVRPSRRREPGEPAVERGHLGTEALGDPGGHLPPRRDRRDRAGRLHELRALPARGVGGGLPRGERPPRRSRVADVVDRRRQLHPGRHGASRRRGGRDDALDGSDDVADHRALPHRRPAPMAEDVATPLDGTFTAELRLAARPHRQARAARRRRAGARARPLGRLLVEAPRLRRLRPADPDAAGHPSAGCPAPSASRSLARSALRPPSSIGAWRGFQTH